MLSAKFEFWKVAKIVDPPSAMITIGGTIAATLIAYPISRIVNSLKTMGKVFKPPNIDPQDSIKKIIELANLARKEGLLALEEAANAMDDKFLQKGILLIVDGTDPELVRNILEIEMSYIEGRHSDARGVWDFMASMGPAYGMVGTLIGLIMMLQDMSDPDALGPNMAIAMITTFYGSIMANFIFMPVSNKLKIFSSDEMLIKEVLIEGMLSIQAGENPRIIEEKLKSFLSPTLRTNLSEATGGE
jgi:chemotaxis protein MotA